MKKMLVLCLIVLIVTVNSFYVFAVEEDFFVDLSFTELRDLHIIPEIYQNVDKQAPITRGAACAVLTIVATGDPHLYEYAEQDVLQWKYQDVKNGTWNCTVAVNATLARILQGEYQNDPLVREARLDDLANWGEVLQMSMRVINDSADELVEQYTTRPGQNPFLLMAEECGIVNHQTISGTSTIWLDDSDMDQFVSWSDFCDIVYAMLYIPETISAYGGYWNHYRINDFIKLQIDSDTR